MDLQREQPHEPFPIQREIGPLFVPIVAQMPVQLLPANCRSRERVQSLRFQQDQIEKDLASKLSDLRFEISSGVGHLFSYLKSPNPTSRICATVRYELLSLRGRFEETAGQGKGFGSSNYFSSLRNYSLVSSNEPRHKKVHNMDYTDNHFRLNASLNGGPVRKCNCCYVIRQYVQPIN